jgi:hypothetical protein
LAALTPRGVWLSLYVAVTGPTTVHLHTRRHRFQRRDK